MSDIDWDQPAELIDRVRLRQEAFPTEEPKGNGPLAAMVKLWVEQPPSDRDRMYVRTGKQRYDSQDLKALARREDSPLW